MKKGIFLSFFSFASFFVVADETLKNNFNQAYKAYQQAVENKDNNSLAALAQKSYELGCAHFGDSSKNCASLAINYALEIKGSAVKANNLFKQAAEINANLFGENSVEVANVYIQKASKKTGFDLKGKIAAGSKAIDIANTIEKTSPIDAALLKLEAGQALLNSGSRKSKVIVEANDILEKNLKNEDARLILSRFWLGKYYQSLGKPTKSITPFEKNIEVFDSLEGPTHPYELVTRAFLIGSYEQKGDSEKATQHCIAIGQMQPWTDDQEQTPLYRVNPSFPRQAAIKGKEGWVKMEFTVSKQGFVEDIEVLDSSGGRDFKKESIKAMKKWRYAPKFENGKAVEAKTTVQLDFKIARNAMADDLDEAACRKDRGCKR